MSGDDSHNYVLQCVVSFVLITAAIIFQCLSLYAVNPPKYVIDSWTTDNGLPQASINSILQTRDGFLWLATYGGLVRYDGLRFQVFNTGNTKGFKTSRFLRLFEDAEGSLWITTEKQGITRYKDGNFTTLTAGQGLPDCLQTNLSENKNKTILLTCSTSGRENSVFQWTGTEFSPYTPDDGEPVKDIMTRTPTGTWYQEGTRLRKFENGQVTVDFEPKFEIRRIFEDSQRRTWIVTPDPVLYMLKDGNLTKYTEKDGYPPFIAQDFFEDRQGRVWFGTYNGGLLVFDNGAFTRYTTVDGLAGNQVLSGFQDREGTIWVGTSAGLSRLTARAIIPYSMVDGLAADNIYPIYEDRAGKIWIGSTNGLTTYAHGAFENVGERYGLAASWVMSLLEDRQGTMWIGTWSDGVKQIKNGEVIAYPPQVAPGFNVRAIYQDQAGAIWFATGNGLVRFKDESFTNYTTGEGLSGNQIFTIYEDHEEQLWIGTDAGLNLYKDGVFTAFGEKDGISGGIVRSIVEDSDGILWIGMYDSGLYRLKDGKFTHYTTNEGLFDNGVFQIIEDGQGNFWISCNLGIYRVKKSELNDFAAGRIRKVTAVPYNKRDGMLNSECNGGAEPAGIKARDGRLWFPTQKGVAVIDPEAVSFDTPPPPTVIESLNLDGKAVDLLSPIQILPEQTYLEIHYSGLSFINPELVKFKYRLEGLDVDWIDAETRRTAYYTHLPPGKYTFRVIASNRDGVWNKQGASIEINVIPPFWRTWWFLALSILIIAAIIFLLFNWRISRLRQENARQNAFSRRLIESQEQERKRIAGELHDGLGQSLVVIKNRALISLNAPENQARMVSQVEEIAEAASSAIAEVRSIARNLHPHQLDHLGLTTALKTMIKSISNTSEIEILSRIDETGGKLSKEADINLYRIVQESLNNIVKHSEATKALVTLKIDEQHLTLRIEDNGKGFDADSEKSGSGLGLVGIAERAKILNAGYELNSADGQGTTISLQMNLPPQKDERRN